MRIEFDGILRETEEGGAYVAVPVDIRAEYGVGRMKVKALFDGIPYEGSVVNMGVKNPDGGVCYIIGVLKSIRRTLGKGDGDTVRVVLTERD